jgi:hypothetical protein
MLWNREDRVQQMMAEHFERWVTEKIPALNGQAPLEAVGDPDGCGAQHPFR